MLTIKNFVEGYKKRTTNSNKEDYLASKLEVKNYLPFVNKIAFAERLAKHSTLNKDTGNVELDSCVNYLLFCRTIIEQYTNLKVENAAFYEEYDLLNESGLLDVIFSMIPEKEINEFKMLCDLKKNDLITNKYEIHNFISDQVTRFGELSGVTIRPIIDKVASFVDEMDEKDAENLLNKLDKILKRIK